MSKKQKIGIIALVLVIAIILVIVIVMAVTNKSTNNNGVQEGSGDNTVVNEEKYTVNLSDGTKLNLSPEFNSTKTYKDLEISNIQYTEKDGKSVMLADVTNKGTSTHEVEIVKLTMIGENGETVTEIKPIIGEIEPGETVKLNASIFADVSNVKDFTIEEAE